MATDDDNHWLTTGDTDGLVKVWDITDYCAHFSEEVTTSAPSE